MNLARVSWTVIILICLVAAALLALGGYVGYSVTAVAVGLAAAVNLIPGNS